MTRTTSASVRDRKNAGEAEFWYFVFFHRAWRGAFDIHFRGAFSEVIVYQEIPPVEDVMVIAVPRRPQSSAYVRTRFPDRLAKRMVRFGHKIVKCDIQTPYFIHGH